MRSITLERNCRRENPLGGGLNINGVWEKEKPDSVGGFGLAKRDTTQ